MRRHKHMWIIAIILVVILAIGVPIGINEAYKANCGYITVWNATDVLSYYGSLLGAIATAGALTMTIAFTRKQIQSDSYLKSETDKLVKIEISIGSILNEINPMVTLKQVMDSGFTDPAKAMNSFQKYQLSCRTATDLLIACVNSADYAEIGELVSRIADVADKLFQVCQMEK